MVTLASFDTTLQCDTSASLTNMLKVKVTVWVHTHTHTHTHTHRDTLSTNCQPARGNRKLEDAWHSNGAHFIVSNGNGVVTMEIVIS